MKLVWHIIKKDIVRDRWALALWALLFVVQIGVGASVLWGDAVDFNWLLKAQTGSMALIWLQMGMGFVLIARWVHSDGLLGSGEFWMTRPLSGARLLAAKVTGVVLVFGFGPVLILLPWWLVSGFGVVDVLWTAGQTLGWQMIMIFPALLIASVTDELGRVLLGTLVLVLAVAVWASLWQLLPAAKIPVAGGVVETRAWLAAGVAVAVFSGIVAQQFMTRRWVRSLVMSVAGVGVVCAVAQLWPWDGTAGRAGTERTAPAENVDGIKLNFVRAMTARSERGTNPSLVEVSWKTTGLPAGLGVRAYGSEHTWRWADGLTLSRELKHYGRFGGAPEPFGPELLKFDYRTDAETLRWRIQTVEKARELSLRRLGSGSPATTVHDRDLKYLKAFELTGRDEPAFEVAMASRMEVSASLAAKMRAIPSEMAVKWELRLVRSELLAELPWKEGEHLAAKGFSVRFAGLGTNRIDGAARVVVSQASRLPWANVVNMGLEVWTTADGEYRNGRFFAVNRTQGNRVDVRMDPASPVVIGGVVLRWLKVRVIEPWVIRDGKQVPRTEGWWDGATLAFVAERELGKFSKAARVEGFLLEK